MINNIGIFCSASSELETICYEEVEKFGKWIGENKKTLVYGGSKCGLMETIASAVHSNGGEVIGVIPKKFLDHSLASEHISKLIISEDLNDRKRIMYDNSDVIVILPGGIGTLDELFTILATNSLGFTHKKIILWNINDYWSSLIALLNDLHIKKTIKKDVTQIFKCVYSFNELINEI